VTFEDGRKGVLDGHIKIVDMKSYPGRATEPLKEAAE
jgi:hypothetical protein